MSHILSPEQIEQMGNRIWVTRGGTRYRWKHMTSSHLLNCADMIEKNNQLDVKSLYEIFKYSNYSSVYHARSTSMHIANMKNALILAKEMREYANCKLKKISL